MATIDKIRKQRTLLIILIGIGMLGFLIPYDAVMALVGVGANKPVGEIGGVNITGQEFSEAVRKRDDLLDYQSRESLENEVWSELLQKNLLEPRFQHDGIGVSDEEFEEIMFGENLSAFAKTTFYGGGTDAAQRENWKTQFDVWQGSDQARYNGYKDAVIEKRKMEKWDNLIKRGIYANAVDGKYDYKYKNDNRSFNYVLAPYDAVGDSLISYDEGDLRAYYRAHKDDVKYEQKTERDIEYVEFKIEPTEEDIANITKELEDIKGKWMTASDDSAFCVLNSNTGQYFRFDYKDGDFQGVENDNMVNDSIGSIIGPYKWNTFMRVVKILDRSQLPDSVECRHILLKSNPGDNLASLQSEADSIMGLITSGKESFEAMVSKFSDDVGSVDKGGVYEWFARGRMVKPFEDACFKGKVGDITTAQTQYGIHIIEILGQKDFGTVMNMASIDRPLKPSPQTIKDGYNSANELAIMFNDLESFENAVDTMGYSLTPANGLTPNAARVGGLSNAAEVARWAYSAEVGEISTPIQLGDKYVVAALVAARKAGVPRFEDIKDQIEIEVIKQKKAEYLIAKMENIDDLQQIADAVGSKVSKASKVPMVRTNLPGSGKSEKETEVVGFAWGVPVGHITSPLIGNAGVYVISGTEEAEFADAKSNYIEEQDALIKTVQNKAAALSQGFYGAIKRTAKVEDNRYGN
ncbi:MAG: peptidylprolyl isomerase [Flavobacteriales bacterium]|nr:peptidylprolyl isomerase [Flavobacteriales bacterium]